MEQITTSHIIYNRSIDFFSFAKSKCENCTSFKLPVYFLKKIDGRDVKSYFKIDKIIYPNKKIKWAYSFEIISKKIIFYDGSTYKLFGLYKKYKTLSVKKIQLFLELINNTLTNSKFNKLSGIIECVTNSDAYVNNDNYGECCICYEPTITRTNCSHNVCVDCWSKIGKKNECPYCRTKKIKIF